MKLRQYERKEICQKAIKQAFDEKQNNHKLLESKMFKIAYDVLFDKKIVAAAIKLPPEWVRSDYDINLNIGGMRIYLANRDKEGKHVSVPMPCGYDHVMPEGEAADVIFSWYKQKDELSKERYDTERKLMALLESVTTLGKLQEIWPEGEQFYLYLIGTQATEVRSGLPAPLLTELNEKLGLNLPKATKKGKTNAK